MIGLAMNLDVKTRQHERDEGTLEDHAMRVSGLVVSGLIACMGGCTGANDSQGDIAAIREVVQTTAMMNNTGDIEGWVALFDEGAVYMPPGQPAVTTIEGLREAARAGFTSWRTEIQITPDEIVPMGDWAFVRSHVSGRVTSRAGGEPIPIDLKQIVIYRRRSDGRWRIARLIGNSNTQ